MPDHGHMMISIPPKYAVSQVIGFIKGKSAIHLARVYGERKRNFLGQHFYARGALQETGARGESPRSVEPLALIAAFRWPNTRGVASAMRAPPRRCAWRLLFEVCQLAAHAERQ
jgi:hypothetical protein